MTAQVVFTPRAVKDIDEASAWYDQQRQGLAARFRSFLEEAIHRVSHMPEMFELVHKDLRRAIVRRFPYCVYFRLEETRLVILGIVHASRADEVWKSRAEEQRATLPARPIKLLS